MHPLPGLSVLPNLPTYPQSGGGATQVWFGYGRATETWKVDPFLYQILHTVQTFFKECMEWL